MCKNSGTSVFEEVFPEPAKIKKQVKEEIESEDFSLMLNQYKVKKSMLGGPGISSVAAGPEEVKRISNVMKSDKAKNPEIPIMTKPEVKISGPGMMARMTSEMPASKMQEKKKAVNPADFWKFVKDKPVSGLDSVKIPLKRY